MTIQRQMYDTDALLGLYRQVEPASTFFRDLCFGSVVTFDDEYIDFEKVAEGRKLAPLVVPTTQGRPVYDEASTVQRFKPAYVKPKDAVTPGRVIKRRPGENLLNVNTMSPQQRYNAIVGDILRVHRETIDRREELMCAQAIIDGKITLSGPDYPTRLVDYRRAAGHTVTLSGTAAWNSGSFAGSVKKDIQGWINTVRRAKFGGPVTHILAGAAAAEYILKDPDILKQLDLNTRGTNANLNTGLRGGEYNEYLGQLSPTLQLWTVGDYYEDAAGNAVKFLSDNDVVLVGPATQATRCFGAILDDKAGFQALPAFPKMWSQEDPSATFVMTQSAPLPVVVNPNNTFKATVLA